MTDKKRPLSFQSLLATQAYINWLIYRRASLTILPFDIVGDHIMKNLECYDCINLLCAIRNHYRKEPQFRYLCNYNFSLAQAYMTINKLAYDIYYYTRPYDFEAYVFAQWSTFSNKRSKSVKPLAKIRLQPRPPFVDIKSFESTLKNIIKQNVKKNILSIRITAHLHSNNAFPGHVSFYHNLKHLRFHKLPYITYMSDSFHYQLCDNKKIINLHTMHAIE